MPKAFVPVGGEALVCRSIRRLAAAVAPLASKARQDTSKGCWDMVLAVHPDDRATHLDPLLPALREHGLDRVVSGGRNRQESMARALAASNPAHELVLVHDAARPFFPFAAVREALHAARTVGAAVLAVPVPDTIKQVDDNRRVITTVDRDGLWLAQTPQVLRRDLLEEALGAARERGTQERDDVALLERLGQPVAVVLGSPANIKITTQADLEIAEALASREQRE